MEDQKQSFYTPHCVVHQIDNLPSYHLHPQHLPPPPLLTPPCPHLPPLHLHYHLHPHRSLPRCPLQSHNIYCSLHHLQNCFKNICFKIVASRGSFKITTIPYKLTLLHILNASLEDGKLQARILASSLIKVSWG